MIDEDIRRRFAEAVRDPARRQFLLDLYVTGDPIADAERFYESAEFEATRKILGPRLDGGAVAEVGAGTGLASCALARAGAGRVYAIEPEAGELGRDAIARATEGLPVEPVAATGEQLPLPDESVDIVYCRQVLHHAADLGALVGECGRILRRGGVFMAAREPIVYSERGRERWKRRHEWLHEGELAHTPSEYKAAFAGAGLELQETIGHFGSVINAFPSVRSDEELAGYAAARLAARFGPAGHLVAVPGVERFVHWVGCRRVDSERVTFVAAKR